MVLIVFGKTECSLCGKAIVADQKTVATSHFIADRDDRLAPFSDSAMHHSCFLAWDQREAFVAKFNKVVSEITFGNGTYHRMESDGTIVVLQK